MGGVWLGSLPAVLADAGLTVQTWPGWETRSRSSGGYDDVFAIGVHHDAIRTGTSLEARCRSAWEQSSDRPIGAMWLHTDGRFMVGAAGATNTQGRGGPTVTSKGTIPLDQGNRFMLSIEASNNGVGEVWPAVMLDAYRRGCAALCKWLGLDPTRDVISHFEWTTRKIDPAGNSDYATGGARWDMARFRADIAAVSAPVPKPDPPPIGDDDVSNVLLLKDVRNDAIYKCGLDSKSWVRDGHMSAQLFARLDESNAAGVAVDGFHYTYMENGNVDVIRSYGPIVGPRPANVDDYGG